MNALSLSRFARSVAMAALLPLGARAAPADATNASPPLRLGVSARTMADMNRNDVVAAMRVWIDTIVKDRGIRFEQEPRVFDTIEAFVAALKAGEVDVVSVPFDEFLILERAVPLAGAYTTVLSGEFTEECVLLVRDESPYRTLADLRDRRLVLLTHPSAGLGPHWLDVELARGKLPPRSVFFREVTSVTKASRAILPVFFKQADACLATRRGFAVAGELNPQLLKQLRVLAAAPPLVPGLGAHRTTVPAETAERFRDAAVRLAETPAGRHVLNLFQCDAITSVTAEDLAPTRAFLAEHERVMRGSESNQWSVISGQ